MNSLPVSPDSLTTRVARPLGVRARAMIVFSATALLLAPGLRAQTSAPTPAQIPAAQPGATKLYSMKFSGGSVQALQKELKAAFPKDNVVVSGSLQYLSGHGIGDFEVRDVRLKELGRTIEFLSDSKLIVEVVESEDGVGGNIWRIGSRLANTPASLFKLQMRSVAAPHLFRDPAKAERVAKDAQDVEAGRLKRIVETTRAGFNDIVGGARVEMLPDQSLFVIVGSEDGIAGVESFIKAAEQIAAEKRAEEKAREEMVRQANQAEIKAQQAARAMRDELAQQCEFAKVGFDRKSRSLEERMEKLKISVAERRKALESKLAEDKGLSPEDRMQVKAELEAHMRNSQQMLVEEEARCNDQLEQVRSNVAELEMRLRAADARLKK